MEESGADVCTPCPFLRGGFSDRTVPAEMIPSPHVAWHVQNARQGPVSASRPVGESLKISEFDSSLSSCAGYVDT